MACSSSFQGARATFFSGGGPAVLTSAARRRQVGGVREWCAVCTTLALRPQSTRPPQSRKVLAGGKGAVARRKYVRAAGSVKSARSPAKLFSQIQASGQRQLIAIAQIANVRLRTAQSSDASSLLEWSGIALVVVALLSIALAWWLAGRALRPLRTMNTRAREISAENLHERLGGESRGDELGELAATFDALLGRLEGAFDSQRRFVANASHELRTPITLERTLLEVALADPDALRRVAAPDLPTRRRLDRAAGAPARRAADARAQRGGRGDGRDGRPRGAGRGRAATREGRLDGITVESELEPAVVVGDEALLERLVANLLDNAIVHNDGEPRWIKVRTGELEGAPGLWIANGGEVVDPDRVEELFEPFRRGTGERVGGRDGGLGLGLSIVRAVAVAHAARIEGHAPPEGGLVFELRFASEEAAKPRAGGLETVPA